MAFHAKTIYMTILIIIGCIIGGIIGFAMLAVFTVRFLCATHILRIDFFEEWWDKDRKSWIDKLELWMYFGEIYK